jgi:5S rRNA maturation endonuclease (ribonuclease M5)
MFTTNQIRRIVNETDYGIPIVVEGKKDKAALSKLGFGKIIDISGKSLHEISDRVKSSNCDSVIILTDFDKEGEIKASQLKKLFTHLEIKVNSFARKRFESLGIHEIEELNSFTKIMEDDYYGKTCSIYDKIFDRSRIYSRRNCRKARCHRGNIRPDRGTARAGP